MKRKARKRKIPQGYDSVLESDLHKKELKGWEHHPQEKVEYEIPHTYEPDFVAEVCLQHGCKSSECRCGSPSKEILVEVKGRFRERKEATKYIHIREALKQEVRSVKTAKQKEATVNRELVFLFQDADKPMPFASRRKDGTKQSHAEWAEKNGFKYFCLKKGLPKKWLTTLK